MLTDLKVDKLKYRPIRSEGNTNPGKLLLNRHPDRDGLYLAISPPHKERSGSLYGSKAWRYDYRWPPTAQGQRQCLTYGRYPDLSLAEAREKHLAARRAISEGVNPAEQKQQAKGELIAAFGNTYEAVSASWFESERKGKSASWIENNGRWAKLVNKEIGSKPIGSVSQNSIFAILRAVEEKGFASSAESIRRQISSVFAYAIRKRLHSGSNPAQELRGEIKVPEAKGNPHIKAREIPEFLAAAEASSAEPQTKLASRLLLLTFVRKQELLAAKWDELDLEGATWEIPAERMKNDVAHLVPLSRQAIEDFRKLRELGAGEHVFPNSQRPGGHMGRNSLNLFFNRIGFANRLTPHGLRSVASTALNEAGFRGDVIERQLSHVEKNQVRRAYNKADHLPERRRMMQFWGDHVDQLCAGTAGAGNVIQIQQKAAA